MALVRKKGSGAKGIPRLCPKPWIKGNTNPPKPGPATTVVTLRVPTSLCSQIDGLLAIRNNKLEGKPITRTAVMVKAIEKCPTILKSDILNAQRQG